MVWSGGAANATLVIDWILRNGGTARWDGEHENAFAPVRPGEEQIIPEHMEIDTLEGTIYASPGDVIIRGVTGEFYPCKPDIFRDTYDILV